MPKNVTRRVLTGPRPRRFAFLGLMLGLVLASTGCNNVLNPAFLNLIASPPYSGGTGGADISLTMSNAAGHVPIIFINNTQFDPTLLAYLEAYGVEIPEDEVLRPRVRVRTQIVYPGEENRNEIEFISGSSIVQPNIITDDGLVGAGITPVDLLENDLENVVAVCDVETVAPGLTEDNEISVEVFVPVFLKVIEVVRSEDIITRELNQTFIPSFRVLQRDEVDDNQNITLTRNFDIRAVPVPASSVQCGTVVGFSLSGTLTVPFVVDEVGLPAPGYLTTDTTSEAAIPGRFEFQTTVR